MFDSDYLLPLVLLEKCACDFYREATLKTLIFNEINMDNSFVVHRTYEFLETDQDEESSLFSRYTNSVSSVEFTLYARIHSDFTAIRTLFER